MDSSQRVVSLQSTSTSPGASVQEAVLSVIADVTRYPRDILTPEAELEDELGIDSVKRAEIFTVLATRFQLPETGGPAPGEVRTIADVIAAISTFLGGQSRLDHPPAATAEEADRPVAVPQAFAVPAAPPSLVQAAALPTAASTAPLSALETRLVEIIAAATRYPIEIIQPGAELEEDLGFDPSQKAAIAAALSREFSLTLPERWPSSIRTIADVFSAVQHASGRVTAPAPRATATPPRTDSGYAALAVGGKPFAGRIALVTGSGHGLGKTIARQLAGLGATIIVNSFHSRQKGEDCAQEIVAEGGQAVHLWGSVANPTQLEQIFEEIGRRFGALDFFVSNASNGVFARLADISREDWDKAFRTNVIALHRGALLAAPLMRRQGGGKIVALSANASQRYVDYFGCMGPVKAAVESLVRYLAIELGEDNIQVNAVAAGPVVGELLDRYPDFERLRPHWESTVPRRRLNNEQEIADAVVFLLSTHGMSGSTMLVDAGGSQRIAAGPR